VFQHNALRCTPKQCPVPDGSPHVSIEQDPPDNLDIPSRYWAEHDSRAAKGSRFRTADAHHDSAPVACAPHVSEHRHLLHRNASQESRVCHCTVSGTSPRVPPTEERASYILPCKGRWFDLPFLMQEWTRRRPSVLLVWLSPPSAS